MMAKVGVARTLHKDCPVQEKVGYEDEPDEPSFARSLVVQFSGHISHFESSTKNITATDEDILVTWKPFEPQPLNILMVDYSGDNDVIIKAAHKSFGFFCLKRNSKKSPCVTENISKRTSKKSFVYAVYLNDIGCIEYSNRKYKSAREAFANVLVILDNLDKNSERTGFNAANIQRLLLTARNNYACVLLREGENEKALSDFRNLYQEEMKAGLKLQQESESKKKDLSLCFIQYLSEMLNFKVILTINYSNASISCEDHGQTVRDFTEGLGIYQLWLTKSENHATKRLFSVALARILAAQGNFKKAFAMLDSQGIDGIIIQKDIGESPLAIFCVREACFLLAQRGEIDKVRRFKEVALKSFKETYDKDIQRALVWMLEENICGALRISAPLALNDLAESMVKRKQNHFEVLEGCEMEDSATKAGGLEAFCQDVCPQTLSGPPSPSNASEARGDSSLDRTRLAHFRALESKRHISVIRRRSLTLIDNGHSDTLVLQGSKVQGLEGLMILFWRTLTVKIRSIKVVTKAEEILSEIHPLLSQESWFRRSSEDKWLIIAALFLLLEELLALETKLTYLHDCICLLYNLAKERREDDNEEEMYKYCFGKLSYFISFDKLHMLDGEIPLTIVVFCGKTNIKNGEDDVTSTGKPLFRKIAFQEPRKDHQEDANRFGLVIYLRSLDLLDINYLRRAKETIVETFKTLKTTSINVGGSVFIQVLPDINPRKLPQLFLHLRLIGSCLEESDELRLCGTKTKSVVQDLHLQQYQKPLTFKNRSDLDIFMVLFQYTFSKLGVDVLQKNRKKMVCLLKEPPFSLLTLHTKANSVYMILQGVSDKCDDTPANGATQLADNTVRDCFKKLDISSINDPQDAWRRLSDEQIDEIPIFCAEEEDNLEKALKTIARLTAENEYLKEKNQKLSTSERKLLDQLFEIGGRASLFQDYFIQTICSNKERAKAAEKWFANKRRPLNPQERPSNDEDKELEELLKLLSIDELAEFATEIQEEKIKGAAGKSFDQGLHDVCVERKTPSEDKTRDQDRKEDYLTIADEKTESSVFTEKFTPTDSPVTVVLEHKDTTVQTDPVQLTNEETLEKGIADFGRDRAERQLRKSRLSQDVVAFKNRPKESTPGSCQDSIVTSETAGFSSEETPPCSITSSSLPEPMPSDGSIVSQAPSHDTEGLPSEESSRDSIVTETSGFYSRETPRDSMTSGSLQSFIVSATSNHGTDGMPSEGTTQNSIISGSSKQLPSKELPGDKIQKKIQGKTERRAIWAARSGGDGGNGNSSVREEKCKRRSNKGSMEGKEIIGPLSRLGKNFQRTERGTRETDLEKGATSLSLQDFVRKNQKDVKTNGQASAEQITSLTAQRVSADVADAREKELRIARKQDREERRRKEEEDIQRRLETSRRAREQSPPTSPQPARLPVQESISEWPCSHYKRKCAIKFPCCEDFYFCHRCHNNSNNCEKDDKKALHGTHLRCLVCNTVQEITENSHHCINCNTQLADYFCGICKHFTGNEKTPYHCGPCGICRIHRDRSFHCDVCNVCLDERLRNNHICRPDSGHDECCICLEDAFGGCQILPCSHKVHRDCAISMLQNGVRKCPLCRHPLNQAVQR